MASDLAEIIAKADLPQVKWPADLQQMTSEQRKAWYDAWLQGDEGKVYRAALDQYNNRRRYPIIVESDGTFRADDVLPGIYDVDIRITDRAIPPKVPEEIARVRTTVTIPPAERDAVNEPDRAPQREGSSAQ
jgi:hypothetical protein